MLERLTKRLSYANVASTLALFVALGGVSYAATSLPARSVGAEQLKPNSVNSSKVKNRSLRAIDFKRGQLPAGAAGPAGPQGGKGDVGANGTNTTTRVVVRSRYLPTGAGQVRCNDGEQATGGGITGDDASHATVVSSPIRTLVGSRPVGWSGWLRHYTQPQVSGASGTVYVICSSP